MDDEQLADQVAGAVIVDVEEIAHAAVRAVAADQVLRANVAAFSAIRVLHQRGDAAAVLLEAVEPPAEAQVDIGVGLRRRQQDRLQVHLRDALHRFQRQATVAAGADLRPGAGDRLVDQVAVRHHGIERPAGRGRERGVLVGVLGITGGADSFRQAELAEDFHGAAVDHVELGMLRRLLAIVDQDRAQALPAERQRQGQADGAAADDEDGCMDHAAAARGRE